MNLQKSMPADEPGRFPCNRSAARARDLRGTCDHFQYTGCNRKDGESHSLNRKPHCIYQRQQEIASRGRHKELVGIAMTLSSAYPERSKRAVSRSVKRLQRVTADTANPRIDASLSPLPTRSSFPAPMFCPLYGAIVAPIDSTGH